MNEKLKGWKTFIGILIAAAGAFGANAGITVNVDILNTTLNSIFEVVGLGIAAYGRLVASGPIIKKTGTGATSMIWFLLFVPLMLGGCANTGVTDADRQFFTDQFVTRSLDAAKPGDEANRRAEIFLKIADTADAVSGPEATTALIETAIDEALKGYTKDMTPADQSAVQYLASRILGTPLDINIPLTEEERKSIATYTLTIRASVEAWQARQ